MHLVKRGFQGRQQLRQVSKFCIPIQASPECQLSVYVCHALRSPGLLYLGFNVLAKRCDSFSHAAHPVKLLGLYDCIPYMTPGDQITHKAIYHAPPKAESVKRTQVFFQSSAGSDYY